MKRSSVLGLLVFALAAPSTSLAQHGGLDLSLLACPDNPRATSNQTLDCAGGRTLVVLGTWAPLQATVDLASLLGRINIDVAAGQRTVTARPRHLQHRDARQDIRGAVLRLAGAPPDLGALETLYR